MQQLEHGPLLKRFEEQYLEYMYDTEQKPEFYLMGTQDYAMLAAELREMHLFQVFWHDHVIRINDTVLVPSFNIDEGKACFCVTKPEKSHRPVVKDPRALEIAGAYGITHERRVQLSNDLNDMAARLYHGTQLGHVIIDEIAKITGTKEEFAWAVFTHAMWLAARGALQNMNTSQLVPKHPPKN